MWRLIFKDFEPSHCKMILGRLEVFQAKSSCSGKVQSLSSKIILQWEGSKSFKQNHLAVGRLEVFQAKSSCSGKVQTIFVR
jgi:tRNA(Phe) wybutosine-synthesizing methylase Tyw3